jgi:hypothetical protein
MQVGVKNGPWVRSPLPERRSSAGLFASGGVNVPTKASRDQSAPKTEVTAQRVERENALETKAPVDFVEVRKKIAAPVRNSANHIRLHHFRRLVIGWEYHVENFFGMVRLGRMKILFRYL